HAQRNVRPSRISKHTAAGGPHEPRGGGFAAAVSSGLAPRQAAGLSLRASRVAAAFLARRAGGPPLTPELYGPGNEQRHGQVQGAARRARGAKHEQPRSNPYNQVSTVIGDCHFFRSK